MSTRKLYSTRSGNECDLCNRISERPLIDPLNVKPSDPKLNVLGVLNPTFVRIEDVSLLIFRVDERPSNQFDNKNSNIDGALFLSIAFINIENRQLEIVKVKVPDTYNPEIDPILPKETRCFDPKYKGTELLLTYISHLRLASLNGQIATIKDSPILFPENEFNQFGCEDPRAVQIEGQTYIIYTAVGRYGATAWLSQINSDGAIKKRKIMLGPDHKHTVLFPEKSSGDYLLLSRPLSRTYINSSGIWLFKSPDLNHWGEPTPLLMPRPKMWDCVRVGPSTSPFRISEGWLIFYYGVDKENSYHTGAALLDIDDPKKILARSKVPVLSPIMDWERNGRRADTVFTCGYDFDNLNQKIRLYYGASDKYICAADVNLKDLLNSF